MGIKNQEKRLNHGVRGMRGVFDSRGKMIWEVRRACPTFCVLCAICGLVNGVRPRFSTDRAEGR
jgi:hypothetical protein